MAHEFLTKRMQTGAPKPTDWLNLLSEWVKIRFKLVAQF